MCSQLSEARTRQVVRRAVSYLSGIAMSSSAKAEAALALHRFGLGPRPGSIAAIEADPRGALIAELERPPASLDAASALPPSARALRTVADFNARQQARAIVAKREKEAKRQQMSEAPAMVEAAGQGDEM